MFVTGKTRKSIDPAIHSMETPEASGRPMDGENSDFDRMHRRLVMDIDSEISNLQRHAPTEADSDVNSLHKHQNADVNWNSVVPIVMTQRPASSLDYMTIVGIGGVRYYIKMKKEDEIAIPAKHTKAQIYKLTEDFDQLLEKAIDIVSYLSRCANLLVLRKKCFTCSFF